MAVRKVRESSMPRWSTMSSYFSANIWPFIYSVSFLTLHGYIANSQSDQLPDGLIAQLVEHCTGVGFRVRLAKFFKALISPLLIIAAMINHVFIFSNAWSVGIHSLALFTLYGYKNSQCDQLLNGLAAQLVFFSGFKNLSNVWFGEMERLISFLPLKPSFKITEQQALSYFIACEHEPQWTPVRLFL